MKIRAPRETGGIDDKLEITVPKVFVVMNDDKHRGELEKALTKYFKLTVFSDSNNAMRALETESPDVVIIENDIKPLGGARLLVQQASSPPCKAGVLLTRDQGEDFTVSLENATCAGRYLTWPFPAKQLMDAITELINENALKSWEDLPETQAKTLKLTVDEYQGIADAIASGEPINYNSAAESCTPLVDAINEGGHHDLLKNVQAHHNYTYVHSMRVATLLTLFGYGIGMRGDDLLVLSTGGLLHDTGKLVTPPNILDKPGKLTEEEWPIMRDHVVESGNLLDAGDDVTKGAKIIAEQHHEKIDGTGYPKGLKGAELNELARMSAIVDIFGALTDERSYKPAFPPAKAFAILESMETGIDQNLLALFKEIFGGDAASGL